jgi:hypothetical protein
MIWTNLGDRTWDSAVNVTFRYGLDSSGSNTNGGERDFLFFTPSLRGREPHRASCHIGTRALSHGKSGRGVVLNSNLHLAPRLRMCGAVLLGPLCACTAC